VTILPLACVYSDTLSVDKLRRHHRYLGFCLDLFHWKTDISTLEDEHYAREELWRNERSFPCRDPVYDSSTYVPYHAVVSSQRLSHS
jgi:hypothetical protein